MELTLRRRAEEEGGWSGRRLKLSTLIRLRWLAVGGQSAAILVVGLWFGFPLPMGACFALIALSAWLNLGLRLVFPPTYRLGPNWAALLLAYDLLQLAGLLYLTGGLENPFAILLLAPAMVSATTQQADKTFLVGAMTLGAATVLVFIHRPLPWFPGELYNVPLHYVGGVWVALVSALGFMAFYAFRVAEEARLLADALAATELVLQREQHLSALDGLAAAAAHELGTPLATIALVAHELASELKPDDPHAEDIKLIRAQSERCREILSKIASLSSDPAGHLGLMPLSHVLEEAVAPHRDFGIAISIERKGEAPEPVAGRNPGLLYGLGNLVDNAVDFARSDGPHPGGMVGDGRDDHHRRRWPWLLARSDRSAGRALRHHAPRRPGAGRGAWRARPRHLHRQDLARALRRKAQARQPEAAGKRRVRDRRLAARGLRSGGAAGVSQT